MSKSKYPNRNTLRDTNDIYLDVMRNFIVHNLKQVKGEIVKDLIEDALKKNENQFDMFQQMLEEHNDVESAIDFNFIPQIIKYHWNVFANTFDRDLVAQNMLWIIRKGRNSCEHRGNKDLDSEFTRTHLFLIAELLGKIKRSDKQSEVEQIRDEFLSDDAEKRTSEISDKLDKVEAEKSQYNQKYLETENKFNELKDKHRINQENLETALSEIKKIKIEKKKIEEKLTTKSNELKETEEEWSKTDDKLKDRTKQLKEITANDKSKKELIDSLKKQIGEVEADKDLAQKNLVSVKERLNILKMEKKETEVCIASLRNQIKIAEIGNLFFQPLSTEPTVCMLDRRNIEKTNYIKDLLKHNQPSIFYVSSEEKINQFYKIIDPDFSDMIGMHYEDTSDEEERELLTKLDNGELISIVSNGTFSTLTQDHCVEHFVFCHIEMDKEQFYKRFQPAIRTTNHSNIHLIYDKQDSNMLSQQYPDRETLAILYKQMKDLVGFSENYVKPDNYYNELGMIKQEFDITFSIFEELNLLEQNENGIKLMQSEEKKNLDDSEIYSEGMKRKEEISEFLDFQMSQSIEQIWEKIVEKLDMHDEPTSQDIEKNNENYPIPEIETKLEHTNENEQEFIKPPSAIVWPQRTLSAFQNLRELVNNGSTHINSGIRNHSQIEKHQDTNYHSTILKHYVEEHGISAVKQGIVQLMQDKADPCHDFTNGELLLLQMCQDTLNEINQQTGETEQIVDYHKMETAENKIDNEITDRMEPTKRKRTKVTKRTN